MFLKKWQDHNEVIERLRKLYPRCFFTDPRQRRPLKRNIVDDIERDREPTLAGFDIVAAVDWYESNIGYEYNLVAGAERIDLNGKVVGKITSTEQHEAQQRIAVKHKQIAEKRAPLKTLQALYGTGGMTDDQLRKVTVPPVAKRSSNDAESKIDSIIKTLTKARELISLEDPALRGALTTAALLVVQASLENLLKQFDDDLA
jgi:sRNA-binding protein